MRRTAAAYEALSSFSASMGLAHLYVAPPIRARRKHDNGKNRVGSARRVSNSSKDGSRPSPDARSRGRPWFNTTMASGPRQRLARDERVAASDLDRAPEQHAVPIDTRARPAAEIGVPGCDDVDVGGFVRGRQSLGGMVCRARARGSLSPGPGPAQLVGGERPDCAQQLVPEWSCRVDVGDDAMCVSGNGKQSKEIADRREKAGKLGKQPRPA